MAKRAIYDVVVGVEVRRFHQAAVETLNRLRVEFELKQNGNA